MNKKLLVIILIIIVALISWLLILSNKRTDDISNTANATSEEVKESEVSFSLQDYNGRIISNTDYSGRPLVLNSWASWCTFCSKELEDFAALQQEYGDRVVIIAINRAETLDITKQYTDGLKVTDKIIFLLDPADSFYKSIGGFTMPETIFLDKNGEVNLHRRGFMTEAEIRQNIQSLLQS